MADDRGDRVVGVFHRVRDGGRIVPVDRRDRAEYEVEAAHIHGAVDGELVAADALPARRYGPTRVTIVERLGSPDAAGTISRLSIASHGIPDRFPADAIAEAAEAAPAHVVGRADLRDLALVTIDGADARDFDDAVWAEPDPDPTNPGGWRIVVAIADVGHYVMPGSALDREAAWRGNSVYFPDRVVPMLPEALSNGLCSLVPGEDRACLAVRLWIDAQGRKRRHRFERALMRSCARLTYEQVQAAYEGHQSLPVDQVRLAALYGAFAALDRARAARAALALDLPDYRVVLDATGQPAAVEARQRLDSHRLIEEFMILANVAAAEDLEARRRPCVYRVHDMPDPERLDALRAALADLGVPGVALAKGQVIGPDLFNRVLGRAAGLPQAQVINDLVLRAQAQAVYSPVNVGHFGLALRCYAHFTSPIRRYADLLVHRALLGEETPEGDELAAIAEHISATERRAASAERSALDRYRVRLSAGMVGKVFAARVTGVARFGLFVRMPDSGTDGLVPLANLPMGHWRLDRSGQRLASRHTRRGFGFGDEVNVRLVEADPIGARLVFRIEDDSSSPVRSGRRIGRRRAGRRGG